MGVSATVIGGLRCAQVTQCVTWCTVRAGPVPTLGRLCRMSGLSDLIPLLRQIVDLLPWREELHKIEAHNRLTSVAESESAAPGPVALPAHSAEPGKVSGADTPAPVPPSPPSGTSSSAAAASSPGPVPPTGQS